MSQGVKRRPQTPVHHSDMISKKERKWNIVLVEFEGMRLGWSTATKLRESNLPSLCVLTVPSRYRSLHRHVSCLLFGSRGGASEHSIIRPQVFFLLTLHLLHTGANTPSGLPCRPYRAVLRDLSSYTLWSNRPADSSIRDLSVASEKQR